MGRRKQRRRKQADNEEVLVDLVQTKESAQSFFEQNQFKVLGGIAIAALLVGALVAYFLLFKTPRETEAMSAMFKAEQQFERDSFALALENPGGGFDGFLDIIDNYNGTKAANLAKYYAGISYLNLGMYDPAIDYLGDFKAGGAMLPITKLGALGDAYSEKGDFEQALSFYKKAATATPNDLLTPYYLQKLGLLAQKQGNADDAASYFNRIKTEFPDSEEGSQVDKYLVKY